MFEEKFNTTILINTAYRYSKQAFEREKKFYNKFYMKFTDFLYQKGCVDNYVGLLIKQLRSFFIYLNSEKGYNTGNFYKDFYIRKEEIPVFVLSMHQLKFLISDIEIDKKLPSHLLLTKDIFILGCTTGLRFSDLINLKRRNLIIENGNFYIVNQSIKTSASTRIKLPQYAIEILKKRDLKHKNLLPKISLNQFNLNIKKIGELAGWTHEIGKDRSRRGVRHELKNKGKTYRFCDLMSSHMMRRTAITTLLTHGMPEILVRKISGHAPGSKEFYKYVQYSESLLDTETDRVFNLVMAPN